MPVSTKLGTTIPEFDPFDDQGFKYGWLRGWKNIEKYTGFNKNTLIRYNKEYGLPMYILPGGMICTIIEEMNLWLKAYTILYGKDEQEEIKGRFRGSDTTGTRFPHQKMYHEKKKELDERK